MKGNKLKKYVFRDFAYTPKELEELRFIIGEIFHLENYYMSNTLLTIILGVNYLVNGSDTYSYGEGNLKIFELDRLYYLLWLKKWRQTYANILYRKKEFKKRGNIKGYRTLIKLENTLYNSREYNKLKRRIFLENKKQH